MKRKKSSRGNPFEGGRICSHRPRAGAPSVVAKVAETVVDSLNERLDARDARRRKEAAERVEKNAARLRAARRVGRRAAAVQILKEAEILAEIAQDTGRSGGLWEEACRKGGVSPRTAVNELRVWDFHHEDPKTFAILSCLGRTKLYQIARLEKGERPKLRLNMVVDVGGAKKTLEELTERELREYLRVAYPVGQRKRRSGLRKHVLDAIAILRDEDKMAKYSRFELEFVKEKTQELFAGVEEELKKQA